MMEILKAEMGKKFKSINNLIRCSDCCQKEPGWNCVQDFSLGYTKCTPICGDKKLVKGEECDDGNHYSGDGCSSKCQLEDGWTCW